MTIKVDLHIHTNYSWDAITSLDKLVDECNKKNIIPAITDHDGFGAIRILKKKGFRFIPGEEINTKEGELIGLFLKKKIEPGMSFQETLKEIKGQGGISYCPHPFDNIRKGVNEEHLVSQCDIIEVFNSRSIFQSMNKKADEFAEKIGMVKGVGSDAHYPFEIGTSYIEMEDFKGPKDFLEKIKKAKLVKRKTTLFVHGTTKLYKWYKKLKGEKK